VKQLGGRIKGQKMGPVTLTPPVDESISDLVRRTTAIGEKVLVAHGAKRQGSTFAIEPQSPRTQSPEVFKLADLTQYWNRDWQLDRAGFGDADDGMGGIRGITYLDGEVLVTYPRDEVRGLVLRRTVMLGDKPALLFQAGVDSGRAWELNVYANNKLLEKRVIEGCTEPGRKWHDMKVDLRDFANLRTHLRIYQRVLVPNRVAGNAYWRNLRVE
jgi:hypothetical protein